MANYKIKVMTFGEAQEKLFGGLNKIRYNVKVLGVSYTPIGTFIGHELLVHKVYNRSKKCTYIVMTDRGVLGWGQPSKDERTLVVRFDGEVDDNDLINNEIFNAFYEDLYNHHENQVLNRIND